jgi:hypothetical protein
LGANKKIAEILCKYWQTLSSIIKCNYEITGTYRNFIYPFISQKSYCQILSR